MLSSIQEFEQLDVGLVADGACTNIKLTSRKVMGASTSQEVKKNNNRTL
jgi:hypothetical protein